MSEHLSWEKRPMRPHQHRWVEDYTEDELGLLIFCALCGIVNKAMTQRVTYAKVKEGTG